MMSEKIVITVEQNERIEAFLKVATKKGHVLINHIDGWVSEENKKLNTLSIDQFARILYEPNSYEVEKPKFEVGDFVARHNGKGFSNGKKILTVKDVKPNGAIYFKETDSWLHDESIRHATKEEIFWAELGRDYRETKIGDCISLNGEYLKVQENMGCERYKNHISHLFAKGILISGHSDGFYPANSFIKLP